MSLIYSMLSEAKAQSPVRRLWLIPSEAPMNRWSSYFLSILSQTLMSAGAQEVVRTIQ
jgi:hypothetical protein